MEPELQQRLKEAAIARGTSVSKLVRSEILVWLTQDDERVSTTKIPTSREEGRKYIAAQFFLLAQQLEWQRKFYDEWDKPENAALSYEEFMQKRADDPSGWRT